MTAKEKLQAKVAESTTEMLVTIARQLNLATSQEEIVVSFAVNMELAKRMPESDFIAFMNELDAELANA